MRETIELYPDKDTIREALSLTKKRTLELGRYMQKVQRLNLRKKGYWSVVGIAETIWNDKKISNAEVIYLILLLEQLRSMQDAGKQLMEILKGASKTEEMPTPLEKELPRGMFR